MSTNLRELSINDILIASAQMAGIMPLEMPATGAQWDARALFGRNQMKLILDKLPLEGVLVRNVEDTTVTLTAGLAEYALASDTIDVIGDGMWKATGQTVEIPVRQVDREEWHRYPERTAQAIPIMMYVQRHAVVSLQLLPVPADAGTIRVQRQRLLADTTDGNATPDLERHWIDYLQHELAARYAFSGGLRDASKDLRMLAKDLLDAAVAKAQQNVDNRLELYHPTGWNR